MKFKSYSTPKKRKINLLILASVASGLFFAFSWNYKQQIVLVDKNNIAFISLIIAITLSGIIFLYQGLSSKQARRFNILKTIYETVWIMLLIAIFVNSLYFLFIAYYPAPLNQSISYYKIVEKGPRSLGRTSSSCYPGIKIKDPDSLYWYWQCLRVKPENVDTNQVIIITKKTPLGNFLEEYYFIETKRFERKNSLSN